MTKGLGLGRADYQFFLAHGDPLANDATSEDCERNDSHQNNRNRDIDSVVLICNGESKANGSVCEAENQDQWTHDHPVALDRQAFHPRDSTFGEVSMVQKSANPLADQSNDQYQADDLMTGGKVLGAIVHGAEIEAGRSPYNPEGKSDGLEDHMDFYAL